MEKKYILLPLFLILFIFSIALVSVGAVIHHQKLIPFDNLVEKTCLLERMEIVEAFPGTWMRVWNGNVVESVFAPQVVMPTGNGDYQLNQSYACICHNVSPELNLWQNACYLNLNATRFVWETQQVYRYGSDALISIGTLLFLAICVGGIVMVVRSKKKADEFVFVLTEKE